MKLNTRKIFITLILIVVLIGLGLGLYWYFTRPVDPETGERNPNPFGTIFQGTQLGGGSGIQGGGSDDNTDTGSGDPGDAEPETPTENLQPQLVLINPEPTGGFVPLVQTEEEEVTRTVFDDEGNPVSQTDNILVEHYRVRYNNIEDGTVYETELDLVNSPQESLIVENFIPNSEQVTFSPDGEHVVFQYWNQNEHVPESYLAEIARRQLVVQPCPYLFEGDLVPGETSTLAFELHQFFNRDPRTQMAESGINSPGNEGNLATEQTLATLRQFQGLYSLEVDGNLGPQTRGELERVCNVFQEQEAREREAELDTPYQISGFFLPQNVVSATVNPSDDELFYLTKNTNGVVGTIRDLETSDVRTVFQSPFSEWSAYWNNADNIQLTTKPSYLAPGFTYHLDPENTQFYKTIGDANGLMTLPSPDNTKILVNLVRNNQLETAILDQNTGNLIPLQLQTLVDKCAWSPNSASVYCGVPGNLNSQEGAYPDLWYQGLVSFTDSLWRIDAQSYRTEALDGFEVNGTVPDIDIELMMVDERAQYLYFIDKNTETLWGYRIDS